jgi:hypothetical protein
VSREPTKSARHLLPSAYAPASSRCASAKDTSPHARATATRRLARRPKGAAESAGRRAAWRDWVLGAVKSRPGLLFKWVKGEASLPLVAVEEDGRWSLGPCSVVEREAGKWKQLWLPEGSERWEPRSPVGPPAGSAGRGGASEHRPRSEAEGGAWCGWLEGAGAP